MLFFLFIPRLLLYGVVCTLLEKHDVAETFFEAATCVQPRSILAWTMLGRSLLLIYKAAREAEWLRALIFHYSA